jgi:hypothetical protein
MELLIIILLIIFIIMVTMKPRTVNQLQKVHCYNDSKINQNGLVMLPKPNPVTLTTHI